MPHSRLTERQVWFFRQTGFLRLEHALDPELVTRLREAVLAAAAGDADPLERDPDGNVIKVLNLVDRDKVFLEVFSSDIIAGPLASLLGPNIELLRNRHNHATLNIHRTSATRLHRDVLQWSRTIVTALISLGDSQDCGDYTYVVPSSHLLPFVGDPNNGGTWMDQHAVYADVLAQAVPVPMSSGGVLFLDGVVFHGAGPHPTGQRPSIALAYQAIDELAPASDPIRHRLLIRGERLYRGNLP